MSGRYKFAKALASTQIIKQDVQEEIPAVLGITIKGKKTVEVPSRPGYLYARIHGNLSELVQAYNDQVSPVYDLRVLLIRDKVDKGRFRIKGRDLGTYQNWGATSYLPKHGAQHSFDPSRPGGDIVWVWGKQFMPLMAVPSGSAGGPNVVIYGSPFQVNGDWAFAGDTGTANIVPDMKPTGAWARMVLVFVDQYGNPQVTGSSTYFDPTLTGTSAILPYVPDIDTSTNVPIAAIRLVSGTSIINWDNIYDFRTHYSMNNSVGHTIQDDGVSLIQRNYLNFIGNGFVVYDDAGKTNVSGTASGGGLSGLTPNLVLFADGAGNVAQDSYFRYTNPGNYNNLIIGGLGVEPNFVPYYNIVSIQDYSSVNGSYNDCYAAFAFDEMPSFHFLRATNTEADPGVVLDGEVTGEFGFYHFGTGSFYFTFGEASYIRNRALGSQVDAFGSELLFGVTVSGSATSREALKLWAEQAWFYKDVIAQNNGAFYLGDPRVTGSWRSIRANNRIEFQEKIGANWTTLGWSNTGSSSGAGGHIIQDGGVDQTARTNLNFVGFTITDDAGNDATKVEIPAGDYAETFGTATGTVYSITHNLGTQDILVQLWDMTGAIPILATSDADKIEIGDVNTIYVTFPVPPGSSSYRVVILRSGAGGGSATLDDYIYADFTTTGTTTNGQKHTGNTTSTFTTQGGIICIYNPIKLDSVLWDIKNTGSYTLAILSPGLLDTFATFPAVYVNAPNTEDIVFTPNGGPITLMPGDYRLRMTADRAVQWDQNSNNSNIFAVEYDDFFMRHMLYDGAASDSTSLPMRLVYYRGKLKVT